MNTLLAGLGFCVHYPALRATTHGNACPRHPNFVNVGRQV